MTNREIDVLVAEKVMGHRPVLRWYRLPFYDCDAQLMDGDGEPWSIEPREEFVRDWVLIGKNEHDEYDFTILPRYSTDIAAAWLVVEKLTSYHDGKRGQDFNIECVADTDVGAVWAVSFGYDTEIVLKTAPLAICLAALKAVGVGVPEAVIA